jgi:hypothetical protein
MKIAQKMETAYYTEYFNVLHLPRIDNINNIQIANKTHYSVYDVVYLQFSHQHVSAAIAAIFGVILLLQQEYKDTDEVSSNQYATPSTHHLHVA